MAKKTSSESSKAKKAAPETGASGGTSGGDREQMLRSLLKSRSDEAAASPAAPKKAKKPAAAAPNKTPASPEDTEKAEAQVRVVGHKRAAGASSETRRPDLPDEDEKSKSRSGARPLAPKQMNKLRESLVFEWQRVAREASRLDSKLFESGSGDDAKSYGAHIAESASINSALEVIRAQSALEGRIMTAIQYALQRMAKGQYGKCERCGANIGYSRLCAKPYASLCVDCRQSLEKDGA